MNIYSPSFGKTTPIIKAKIQNKKSHSFENATIYKVDAQDKRDFLAFSTVDKNIVFKDAIAYDVQRSYEANKNHESFLPLSYYLIRDERHRTLGIAETMELKDSTELNYVSTKPNSKYKYVGQALLASIAKDIKAKGNKDFVITTAADTAFKFYTDVCGFEIEENNKLRMHNSQIPIFINQTEQRTKFPLVNCKG